MQLGYFCCDVMLGQKTLMSLDVRNDFITYEVYDEKQLKNIWEFRDKITAGNIYEWLLSRLPDDNRQNLLSECSKYGIKPIGADIFRISEGKQLYDSYWFKFPDSKSA